MEHDDEIYLIDVWRMFVREWRWFAGVLLVVLACTYAFVHAVKPQWEATAWIQVGQIGQVPSDQDPKMVEPLMRAVERMQLAPFENDVLKSIGFGPDSPEARLYRKSLKLEPMPYAGQLIRMTVRANTPQLARQLANATVTQLHGVHQRLEESPLESARARLVQVQSDLQDALADRDHLLQASGPGNKEDTASKSMAAVLLASKNEDIRSLQKTRNDLADHLSPTYTYETSMPWPVYVPRMQAFPNHALIYGIGLLLGLFLAAFAATTRNVMRRAAAKRPVGA